MFYCCLSIFAQNLTWKLNIFLHLLHFLTFSQTSPGFYASAVQDFWKQCEKNRNCSLRAISPFPIVFSTRFEYFLPLLSNLKLSSANSFIFKECEILSFGKGLTHYQKTNFRLFQTERVCRRQFQIWWKWQKVIQTGRKHCGKRRNCSSRAISSCHKVFSKGLFSRGVKRCHCVGRVKVQGSFFVYRYLLLIRICTGS